MLKKFFVPHEHNQYHPHIFRTAGLTAFFAALVVILAGVTFQGIALNQSDYLASVGSAVLVDLANTDRAVSTVPPLSPSPLLTKAAQEKADDMAAKGYFSHTSPTGVTPWHWFTDVGYDYAYAGENLAIDFTDSAQVNQAWMNSPAHRANLIDPGFTEIGIATAQGVYQGHQTTFVVQLFGKPKARRVPITETNTLTNTSVKQTATSTTPALTVSKSAQSASRANSTVLGERTPPPVAASSLDHVLTSPSRTLQIFLGVIGAIIICSLISVVIIEVRRKKYHGTIIGVSMLMVISLLIYFSQLG